MSAREKAELVGVGRQFAQHQQAHEHAVLAAVEQRRERLQHRLRALEVKTCSISSGATAVLEVGLQAGRAS
jgi:hypothetical protein